VSRKAWVLAGVAVLIAVTVAAGAVITSGAKQQALAAQRPHVSTATVQREKLSATVSVDGTLTYAAQADGSSYAVINEAHGTYTKLPTIGQVIRQGQVLYRVNDSPVVLLDGTTPAYRTLSTGASGPDVAELNADLVRLGYATRAELSPASSSFDWATATALEKLQAAVGLVQTGTLTLGQALFAPTAVRVTALAALLGGSAGPGQPVLQGTSTKREVQVALDATQQTDVAVGDKVTITLPNNRISSGVVSTVGTVASCPSSSGPGGSGASSSAASPATDSCSSGNSSSSMPTINVNIIPTDLPATGMWDQAPVQVGITTAEVRGALTVPVNALVARASGGYAVEVTGAGGANHLVPVSLGLFDDADGLVQVTGSTLAAGQQVVVPST
jgi:Putative peptidoglycan binding domain